MVNKVDVLICGSGSAGLCAAVWLALYGVNCKILEKNNGPLKVGQADGVQCRTVEIFNYFGKGPEILRDGCHIKEVCFWSTGPKDGLARKSHSPDTAPNTSHMPHLILNQARINQYLLDLMQEHNDQVVDYGYEVEDVQVDVSKGSDPEAYPVTVRTTRNGEEKIFQAKYLFGSDGAHSRVRKSLGIKMIGDSTNRVWGVVDTYPRTDFPDIRKKCFLTSKDGSIIIIPREGGSLVRFYIELHPDTSAGEVTLESLCKVAQAVFSPYEMQFTDIFWWSAYSIGQRQAECFTKDNRVFLAGDACHTHSPKAGQGMNVSLQDGYNFGWKAAMVLKRLAKPALLSTYVFERESIAADLIEFDKYWSKLVSARDESDKGPEAHLSSAFDKARAYTAGITAKYEDSVITSASMSKHHLAKNVTVGLRLPSTRLTRMADAKPMHLSEAIPADGRWRILVFGGDLSTAQNASKLQRLGEYLDSAESPIRLFTPPVQDIDSVVETLVILSGRRHSVDYPDLHKYFWPVTGKHRLRNLYKVLFDDEAYYEYGTLQMRVYEFYGIDSSEGATLVVRPDQHVSLIAGVEDFIALRDFFEAFALRPVTATLE